MENQTILTIFYLLWKLLTTHKTDCLNLVVTCSQEIFLHVVIDQMMTHKYSQTAMSARTNLAHLWFPYSIYILIWYISLFSADFIYSKFKISEKSITKLHQCWISTSLTTVGLFYKWCTKVECYSNLLYLKLQLYSTVKDLVPESVKRITLSSFRSPITSMVKWGLSRRREKSSCLFPCLQPWLQKVTPGLVEIRWPYRSSLCYWKFLLMIR